MLKKYSIKEASLVEDNDGALMLYMEPNEEEINEIINEHKIRLHSIVSSLDENELSRLAFSEDHLSFVFKAPKESYSEIKYVFRVASIGMFLFKEKLIIISKEDLTYLINDYNYEISSFASFVLNIIYNAISLFLKHLYLINKISDDLESKANNAISNDYLLDLFSLDKALVYYLNASNSNGQLLDRIKENSLSFEFSTHDEKILDEIITENNQLYKQAEIYSNILASLVGANAAIVSNNLAALMKTLTIITIAIMLPSLIVAIFSMNVPLPIKPDEWTFWQIIAASLISTIAIFAYWRLKKN